LGEDSLLITEKAAQPPLELTGLSRLEIGGSTRFQGVLWRMLFPASAQRQGKS